MAYGAFEESHSHATSHRLLPTRPELLGSGAPVVLVDDELSTGATIINTITELHGLAKHSSYTVATLIDLRSAADRARFGELARELGCTITVVALGTGGIDLGEDLLARAQALIEGLPAESAPVAAGPPAQSGPGTVTVLDLTDSHVLDQAGPALRPVRSDRFGVFTGVSTGTAQQREADARALPVITAAIRAALPREPAEAPVLVLGTEEFIHLPLTVAAALDAADGRSGAAGAEPGRPVRFSTTTRSPIVPIDHPGYAIRNAVDVDPGFLPQAI